MGFMTYVGMTRARYQLYIPYVKQNDLIKEILIAHKECRFD